MKKIIIAGLALFLICSGCKKEDKSSKDLFRFTNQYSYQNSVADSVSNYLRIISLASIDIFSRNDVRELLIALSSTSSSQSDSSDYYVYLSDLAQVYDSLNIDLVDLMEESLSEHGGTQDMALFQQHLFSYTYDEKYRFDVRYFLPFRNTTYYNNMTLPNNPNFGTWLFTIDENFHFPGMAFGSNNVYNNTSWDVEALDSEPMVLISASCYSYLTESEIDMKPFEACGRCKPHGAFPSEFCPGRGRQCKCSSSPMQDVIDYIESVF